MKEENTLINSPVLWMHPRFKQVNAKPSLKYKRYYCSEISYHRAMMNRIINQLFGGVTVSLCGDSSCNNKIAYVSDTGVITSMRSLIRHHDNVTTTIAEDTIKCSIPFTDGHLSLIINEKLGTMTLELHDHRDGSIYHDTVLLSPTDFLRLCLKLKVGMRYGYDVDHNYDSIRYTENLRELEKIVGYNIIPPYQRGVDASVNNQQMLSVIPDHHQIILHKWGADIYFVEVDGTVLPQPVLLCEDELHNKLVTTIHVHNQ